MRVLLDECLPRGLKTRLAPHEVSTVHEMRWAGKANGELLRLAVDHFDVFLTMDRNLQFQQNPANLDISVIALSATSNALPVLQPLIPSLLAVLPEVRPGTFHVVTRDHDV